jgi:DNA-binding NarL/FixJ family response regulator
MPAHLRKQDCMPTVRIRVVDDHALVRRTMCSLLSQDSTLDVICETASGEDAVLKACEHQPDLVLLDIGLPGISGIEAAASIGEASSD